MVLKPVTFKDTLVNIFASHAELIYQDTSHPKTIYSDVTRVFKCKLDLTGENYLCSTVGGSTMQYLEPK